MANELLDYFYNDNVIYFSINSVGDNCLPVAAIYTFDKKDKLFSYLFELTQNNDYYSLNLLDLVRVIENNKKHYFSICLQDKKTGTLSECLLNQSIINKRIGIQSFFNTNIVIESVNESGSSFLTISKSVANTFYVKKAEKEPLSFIVETNINDYSLFVGRRNGRLPNFVYDVIIELPAQSFTKQDIFDKISKYVCNAGEIWDVVASINGILFPLIFVDDFKEEYTNLNYAFVGKIFMSTNKMFSIFVNYGKNENQKKIKICVIGSCYTKQPLHAIDYMNPDYKLFYENDLIIFHSSFISMMSNKIEFDSKTISEGGDQRLLKRYGRQEFDKDAIQKIKDYKPDYILVDLFIESREKLCIYNEGSYVSDSFFFNGTEEANILKNKDKILPNDTIRFQLFQEAVGRFADELQGVIPMRNIILLEPHAAKEYIDDDKTIKRYPDNKWVENYDMLWDKYNSMFIQLIPECRVIDMRNKNYYGDKKNPLSFSTNHLETDFYKEVLNKLNKIVLKDLITKYR